MVCAACIAVPLIIAGGSTISIAKKQKIKCLGIVLTIISILIFIYFKWIKKCKNCR